MRLLYRPVDVVSSVNSARELGQWSVNSATACATRGRTPEQVITEIQRYSGTQFHPTVADAKLSTRRHAPRGARG
jgi:hypothetical protein